MRPLQGADVSARRELLGVLIEQVRPVRGDRRGEYTADVNWSPLGSALRTAASLLNGQVAA